MNTDSFWIHNPSNLFQSYNINLLEESTFSDKLNKCTRILFLIYIILCIFEYKYDVEVLIIGIIIIFLFYYIQKNTMNIESYTSPQNTRKIKIGIVPPPKKSINDTMFSYTIPIEYTENVQKIIQIPYPKNPDNHIQLMFELLTENVPVPTSIPNNIVQPTFSPEFKNVDVPTPQNYFTHQLPWEETKYIPYPNIKPLPKTVVVFSINPNKITTTEIPPSHKRKSERHTRTPIYSNTQLYTPPQYPSTQIPPTSIHCDENSCNQLTHLSYNKDCGSARNTLDEQFQTNNVQVDVVPSPYDSSNFLSSNKNILDTPLQSNLEDCSELPSYQCGTFDANSFIYDPKDFGYGTSYRCHEDTHIGRTQYDYDDINDMKYVDPFRHKNTLLQFNKGIDTNCPLSKGNRLTQKYNYDKENFYNTLTKDLVDKIKCRSKFLEENPMRTHSLFK